MKNTVKLLQFFLITAVIFAGCKKEESEDPASGVVASFQYEVSPTNWAEVTFMNFSQNATSYVWDFGDGDTSTEANPTHTYGAGGSYDVTLTASGSGGSASKTETIMVVNPDDAAAFLAGASGKVWHLNRETIALGIGPTIGDDSWWSFGGVTPLGDRPCILDDSYTFNPDGTFEKNTENTVFVDSDGNGGWLGPNESCYDETEPGVFTGPNGEDLSALGNGGSYTYDYNTVDNTITIDGLGGYIGLPNKTDAGDNYNPILSKTYRIFGMGTGTIADTLDIAIVALDASFSWNFHLVSYHDPADLPPIPASAPSAGFTYVKTGSMVEFTNTSTNATSYMWDFGDGNMSSEEDPVHTYGGDGDYTVTLTAMDDNSQSDETSEVISISSAVFSTADLSSAAGKVWKLDGAGSYIVGSAPGLGDYWPGIDENGAVERACQMDDEFIFFDDGTFEINTQGEVWAEGYMGGDNSCVDPSTLPSPFDAYGDGTHSYSASDTEITVNGIGAYIGFNKPFNEGELPNDATGTPASAITYTVHEYSNNGGVERLTVVINYEAGTNNHWSMRMISE